MCSENKGADQLRSYREADLRLFFRISKKPVFSRRGSFDYDTPCASQITALFTILFYGTLESNLTAQNKSKWRYLYE